MMPKSGHRFSKRSCSNKKPEPSSDSTKNDNALRLLDVGTGRRAWQIEPLGSLSREIAISKGLLAERLFQSRIHFPGRQFFKLERVLQIFRDHLHGRRPRTRWTRAGGMRHSRAGDNRATTRYGSAPSRLLLFV